MLSVYKFFRHRERFPISRPRCSSLIFQNIIF
nr:MAG TPA: hypothetical protein [Bacteriophage sp.]DAF40938.1 MAG TPA: hypothetical protein [Bacteriophage sp.]DAV79625.1 MAG TPA: hypothetical protein [Bacteriophage sp.]